jgi:hypothetical protein
MNKLITLTTSALVAIIALISFIISYHALQGVASTNGLDGWLSYLWPLLIDLALIVFSLCVVTAHLHSESTFWQWCMVIGCTLATITYNYLHAPNTYTAQSVAIIPPVMLFCSFELLMMQLKNSIKRTQVVEVLQQQVVELKQEADSPVTYRRQLVASMLGNKTQKEMAGELEVSISTIRSDIKALGLNGVGK